MAPPPAPGPALVIGCGYLGRRVAAGWVAAGRRVAALTRGRAAELTALGIEPVVGDVLDPASLRRLPAAATVLYAVGFDRAAGRPMRDVYVTGLGNVLAALAESGPLGPRAGALPEGTTGHPGQEVPPACGASGPPGGPTRFIYVSSTGVYGQADGSEVDEDSPTEPVEESGRVVLAAEGLLRAKLPAAVVLRFAGLYGPGRLLRRQPLLAGEPLVGDAGKWLNLVHVADGARAVLAAEQRARPGETYLVADGAPVRRRDFYTHLARLVGAPEARFEPGPAGPAEPNRRVTNRKARAALGWEPEYPTYVEGLAASV